MTSVAKIKKHVSKMNSELVSLSKMKLTEDERSKHIAESGLWLASGDISLLKPIHMIFWTQGTTYTHTSTPQEIRRVMQSAEDFGNQFNAIDKAIGCCAQEMFYAAIGKPN